MVAWSVTVTFPRVCRLQIQTENNKKPSLSKLLVKPRLQRFVSTRVVKSDKRRAIFMRLTNLYYKLRVHVTCPALERTSTRLQERTHILNNSFESIAYNSLYTRKDDSFCEKAALMNRCYSCCFYAKTIDD